MIHWPILSDLVKYIDGSSCSDMIPSLTVNPLGYWEHKRLYHSLKTNKVLTSDVLFEGNKVRDEYFNKYDGIFTDKSRATRFDESTDLSTTYLGKMDMTRDMIIKAEEKFLISVQGYTNGKLLDNTECSILIYTGASIIYVKIILYVM